MPLSEQLQALPGCEELVHSVSSAPELQRLPKSMCDLSP